jgi:RNA polymerase sigma-70 factor (ECF subfamily)
VSLEIEQIVRTLTAEHNKLGAYVWSITGDFDLCEDVLQEVALLAMEKAREVADEARLKVWLRRAARLKALEALRQKRRAGTGFSEETLEKVDRQWEEFDQQGELTDSVTVGLLRACMSQLTLVQRRLLNLRYAGGLHSSEIAKRLNMRVKTVYQAITRAHRTLFDCVQKKRLASTRQASPDE